MACMHHICWSCGESVFNNEPDGGECLLCGGDRWVSHFDEPETDDEVEYDYGFVPDNL